MALGLAQTANWFLITVSSESITIQITDGDKVGQEEASDFNSWNVILSKEVIIIMQYCWAFLVWGHLSSVCLKLIG